MLLRPLTLHDPTGLHEQLPPHLVKLCPNRCFRGFQGHAIRAYTDGDRRLYGRHGRLTSWLLLAAPVSLLLFSQTGDYETQSLHAGAIDGGDQHQAGTLIAQPVVIAAVHLQEHPRPGSTLAVAALAWRATFSGGGRPNLSPDAAG